MWIALALAVAAIGALAAEAPVVPDFIPTKFDRIILLDAVHAGTRLLAVGERGVLVRSGDGGAHWQAQRLPTTQTLTALAFNDENNGVAVGHDATVLRTADGGATWKRVKIEEAGIDSFLGATALGGTRIVIYGAFGEFYESNDNGATWQRERVIDKDFDRHISQVIKVGDRYLLVGESGTLALSDDLATWKKLAAPYEGSYFGGLVTKGGAWLIYGMRGNVYRSEDAGASWSKVDLGTHLSVMNGRVLADGRIVLVGINGLTEVSSDDGKTFVRRDTGVRQSLAQVLPLADGAVLVVGERGIARIDAKALSGN
jgi:photosystem II stability/assembly factor-like uncharacterized protein